MTTPEICGSRALQERRWRIAKRRDIVLSALRAVVERSVEETLRTRPETRKQIPLTEKERTAEKERRVKEKMKEVEDLYKNKFFFKAEVMAGLMIWAGGGVPEERLHECHERLGLLLTSLQKVILGLATMEVWHAWLRHADSLENFIRVTLRVAPKFYTRLTRLAPWASKELPYSLSGRGQELRAMCLYLVGLGEPLQGVVGGRGGGRSGSLLPEIEAEAEKAVSHLLWLGKEIRKAQVWEEWKKVAKSYQEFLEEWLGVELAMGQRMASLSLTWRKEQQRKPLRNLELAIEITGGRVIRSTSNNSPPKNPSKDRNQTLLPHKEVRTG